MIAQQISTSKNVEWTSVGIADTTGEFSGYNPDDLLNITIDYQVETDIIDQGNILTYYASGDLFGTYPSPIVQGIQQIPVSENPPMNDGDILTYDLNNQDLEFKPITFGGTPFGGGDKVDGYVLTYVVGNDDIELRPPTGGGSGNLPPVINQQYAVVLENPAGHPVFQRLTQDMILPGFSINSFTGGSVVEVGVSIVNPAFAATYSSTPTSANITNTDGINSPHSLSSPFTSGTIIGTFVHNVSTSITFTLNAFSGSINKSATSIINWFPRSFAGSGASGAVSATASGTSAILNGGAGTLSSAGLHSTDVGQTYSVSPSGNYVYLFLVGGSHIFKDTISNFPFVMNTPTSVSFVNQNGATIAMFLYQSQNSLTGTFNIQIVS